MNALETALYTQLTGGTALTALLAGTTSVYNTQAPPGAAFPYVVFNLASGLTENVDDNERDDLYYTVKGVGTATMGQVGNIAAQLDSLLHKQSLSVSGYTNLWQRRTARVQYAEVDAGITYYHQGGTYRFRLHKD